MWQTIGILLISAQGVVAHGADLSPPLAGINEQRPLNDGGWANSIQASSDGTVSAAECCCDPGSWFGRQCAFNSVWDVTGGRPPTDYAGLWGYGPDCTVARARFEWLLWFSRGRDAPILVRTTTAATSTTAGRTSDYPGEPIGTDVRHGARITLGHLLADEVTWLEGRFWGLEDSPESFVADSSQTPSIIVPYFSVSRNRPFSEIVAAPGESVGHIRVLSKNDLFGADAWMRRTWWDDGRHRLDFLAGYQFTRMDDSLVIDRSTSLIVAVAPLPAGTHLVFHDSFRTQNEFHGGSLGFVSDWRKNALSLEVLGKIALGNIRQRVVIDGRSTFSVAGSPGASFPLGLFAEPSNIGTYNRNRFTFIPELNVNGVLHFSPQWRAMIGYSLLYWNNVVLAGNQIDTRLNLPQVPGPLVGPARPHFGFNRNDFFVQGISLGAEYRW